MNIMQRFAGRFGPQPDMLGFTPDAKPTAHEWLIAFTDDFMGHADAAHSTQAFMSGMRFYTPACMTALAELPALETHERTVHGRIPEAIYKAAAYLVGDAYTRLISRNSAQSMVRARFS